MLLCVCRISADGREWFSGRTLASQARNEGSIPFSRSIQSDDASRKKPCTLLCYDAGDTGDAEYEGNDGRLTHGGRRPRNANI